MNKAAEVIINLLVTVAFIAFIYFGLYSPRITEAASMGPKSPKTAAGVWTNPNNALTSDTAYATYNLTEGANLTLSKYVFTIPAASKIDGIEVSVKGFGSNAANRTIAVSLTKNGTAAGTAKTQLLTGTDATYTLGTASDLWGATWLNTEINSETFGVMLRDPDATASGFNIDHVSVTVTYTPNEPMMHNSASIGSGKWGADGWGIAGGKYGEFVCETCHTRNTPNIKRVNTSVAAPDPAPSNFPGTGQAIVFNITSNGASDFGDDSSAHATSTKICEVCHTYDAGSANGVKYHAYDMSADLADRTHNNNTDCMTCHWHAQGFKPSCRVCHGFPPIDSETMVSNPSSTGSATAGAHAKHASSSGMSYSCDTCHFSGMPATPINGNNRIQIGFNVFGTGGGSYDGQALINGFVYEGKNSTTITTGGSKTCSGIYCHGSTMTSNNGTNLTPVWDNPATAACGTCHGATAANPPLRGSHRTHTMNDTWWHAPNTDPPFNNYIYGRNIACTVCHNNYPSSHVNGKTDWSFDVSTYPMLSGAEYMGGSSGSSNPVPVTYGQCANLYCHSIVQTSTGGPLTGLAGEYKAPTWGNLDEGTCGTCHYADAGHSYWADKGMSAIEISSGSHTKHLDNLTYTVGGGSKGPGRCAACHNYVGSDNLLGCASVCHNSGNLHVNYQIDVKFPPTKYGSSASYTGTPDPGNGYGNCSNTYCHGNGTSVSTSTIPGSSSPDWGAAGPLACNSCHAYPPAYSNGSPKANSHVRHGHISCEKCHWATTQASSTINDYSRHVNQQYDIGNSTGTITYTFSMGGGSCSGTFACHGNATWGTSITPPNYANCLSCHKTAMGSRRQIVDSNGDGSGSGGDFKKISHHHYPASGTITNADCQVCHDTSLHPGGNIRLKNADTGEVYIYSAASPSTAEDHCLSCHDADGAGGNMIPFSDGKVLGQTTYRSSIDIKSNWDKNYGHRQKGLTCLGDGTPNTGCHVSGHGSDYKGLLSKNLTLPNPSTAYYSAADEGSYDICFNCHQNYPRVTKEAILGYRLGGNYDLNGEGPPPYNLPNILTLFRDRNGQGTGNPYDNPLFWTNLYTNLHYFHVQSGGWSYRGATSSSMNCIACHNVHGSNTASGWTYDEMQYNRYTGTGSDQYGTMDAATYTILNNYPTNCTFNCHSLQGKTHNWFEPPGE